MSCQPAIELSVTSLNPDNCPITFSEIDELRSLKAKHSHGGEYAPAWLPPVAFFTSVDSKINLPITPTQLLPPPPEPPAIEGPPPAAPEPRPGGWRIVHKRPERRPRPPKGASTPAPVPPAPAPEPPRIELPAWRNWRRQSPTITFVHLMPFF